jgi:aryl-alcohol dehydrogenase-like predicted oxidoreductase
MFGTQWGYGAEPEEARPIFDAYAEAGGNFIDTADGYQFGQSEQLVGGFLGAERDNFVVATKYTGGALADGGSFRHWQQPEKYDPFGRGESAASRHGPH